MILYSFSHVLRLIYNFTITNVGQKLKKLGLCYRVKIQQQKYAPNKFIENVKARVCDSIAKSITIVYRKKTYKNSNRGKKSDIHSLVWKVLGGS